MVDSWHLAGMTQECGVEAGRATSVPCDSLGVRKYVFAPVSFRDDPASFVDRGLGSLECPLDRLDRVMTGISVEWS